MEIESLDSPEALAARTAEHIAHHTPASVAARARCVLALSGGTEPWAAARALAAMTLPWHALHVVQVDERAAPPGHRSRNWTHLEENLLQHAPIPRSHGHAMPVDDPDLEGAAQRYARTLETLAGVPPVLDLVHLGLGDDGHTASLVPGDPVLELEADVGVTAPYRGWRRMTLTFAAINRARAIVWLIRGENKAQALSRLLAGDPGIPASRVRRDNALLLTERDTLAVATGAA